MQTLDPGTKRGARALKSLETDPRLLPRRAPRNANIEANPPVAFNLDSDPDRDHPTRPRLA